MQAHINNETRYLIETGGPSKSSSRLVHLVITDACLSVAGVDLGTLKELVARRGVAGTWPNQIELSVEIQTRFHATGVCTDWVDVDANYVSSEALVGILIPKISRHTGLFAATRRDAGGLHVSLPVECDEKGRFDPYNVVVLRLCTTPTEADYPFFLDLEFTYEELLPEGTRFEIDVRRTTALCLQFIRHSRKVEQRLGQPIVEMRDKLEALLAVDARRGTANTGDAVAVDVLDIVESNAPFDDPQTASRIDKDNIELNALIHKAASAINKRRPVGRCGNRFSGGVVSGLRQGALAVLEESGGSGRDARTAGVDQGVVLSGLEPAGRGRFVGGTANSIRLDKRVDSGPPITQALEDVLLFDGLDKTVMGPRDVLGLAVAIMAGGSTPEDEWRLRPISAVPRTHFGTGQKFYVISYEASLAWGGKGFENGATVATSLGRLLAEACAASNVSRPVDLGMAERRKIVEDAPVLAAAFGLTDTPQPLRPFSIGAEAELKARFRAACTNALARAVGTTIKNSPPLRQLLSYDVLEKHEIFVHTITDRAPGIIAACVMAVVEEQYTSFERGALARASLAYLTSLGSTPYITYASGRRAGHPAMEYVNSTAERGIFVFDYYSAGGECVKVSNKPIPIMIDDADGLVNAVNGDETRPPRRLCAFPPWFTGRAICERYLPGESYAYVCLGYNEHLDVLIVLPGGYALYLNVTQHFYWPDDIAEAVLARSFRLNARRRPFSGSYKY